MSSSETRHCMKISKMLRPLHKRQCMKCLNSGPFLRSMPWTTSYWRQMLKLCQVTLNHLLTTSCTFSMWLRSNATTLHFQSRTISLLVSLRLHFWAQNAQALNQLLTSYLRLNKLREVKESCDTSSSRMSSKLLRMRIMRWIRAL